MRGASGGALLVRAWLRRPRAAGPGVVAAAARCLLVRVVAAVARSSSVCGCGGRVLLVRAGLSTPVLQLVLSSSPLDISAGATSGP